MSGQRIPQNARLTVYFENAFRSDTGITAGYVWPLVAQESVTDTQNPIEVPLSDGSALPNDDISGTIDYGGDLPTKFEYELQPRLDKIIFGGTGYVGPSGSMPPDHEFTIPTGFGQYAPGSLQLQKEFGEAPAQYHRGRGVKIAERSLQAEVAGFCKQTYKVLGAGDVVLTDLGGTKSATLDEASSYNDGRIYETRNGVRQRLTSLDGLQMREFNNAKRQEEFYNDGIAGAVNPSNFALEMQIALAMQTGGATLAGDLNGYLAAVNRDPVAIDFIQANAPLVRCTKFARHQLFVRLYRQAPTVGGTEGIKYTLKAMLRRLPAVAKTAAELIAMVRGPFNIDATNDHLTITVGGVPTTVTLTHGGAVPLTQVITDITTAAIAGVTAEDFFGTGWLHLFLNTPGAAGSLQTTGNALSLFGFDSVVRNGRDFCPYRKLIRNATSTSY